MLPAPVFAEQHRCFPVISESRRIHIFRARHTLLFVALKRTGKKARCPPMSVWAGTYRLGSGVKRRRQDNRYQDGRAASADGPTGMPCLRPSAHSDDQNLRSYRVLTSRSKQSLDLFSALDHISRILKCRRISRPAMTRHRTDPDEVGAGLRGFEELRTGALVSRQRIWPTSKVLCTGRRHSQFPMDSNQHTLCRSTAEEGGKTRHRCS